jgi:V/A-type H+-transporting ATPase subunit C
MYNQIYSFAEGRLREMIGLYLERYDLDNVKAIVRGKVYGAPASEIEESLLPAGELAPDLLSDLVQAKDVDGVFALLGGTIFAASLAKLGKRPSDVTDWSRWEDVLSQLYYARLLDSVAGESEANRLLKEFIQREIDVLNLKSLLRTWLAKSRFNWEIFIDGGRELKLKDLHDLVASDEADLLKRLSEFDLSKPIVPELQGLAKKGVGSVMRRVEIERLRLAERYSHLHPLSVLPVLDFILRKDREVQNLRIIARGKESGLPTPDIRALLVI